MSEGADISVLSPKAVHQLERKMQMGLQGIVDHVVREAGARRLGKNLLLEIYMAGVHHGFEMRPRYEAKHPAPRAVDRIDV
jgi:hypothetical protein